MKQLHSLRDKVTIEVGKLQSLVEQDKKLRSQEAVVKELKSQLEKARSEIQELESQLQKACST